MGKDSFFTRWEPNVAFFRTLSGLPSVTKKNCVIITKLNCGWIVTVSRTIDNLGDQEIFKVFGWRHLIFIQYNFAHTLRVRIQKKITLFYFKYIYFNQM